MASELKPCPFCGGEVEKVFPPCSDLSEYIRHIEGGPCAVEFSAFTLDGDVAEAWNTRQPDPTPLVEALRACHNRFREYAQLHAAKLNDTLPDAEFNSISLKSARNRAMADMCKAALTQWEKTNNG